MAKRITYKVLFAEVNNGTNEEPNIEQIFIDRVAICPTETSFNDADYQKRSCSRYDCY